MPSFNVGDRVRGNIPERTGTIARLIDDQYVFVRYDVMGVGVRENVHFLTRVAGPAPPSPRLAEPPRLTFRIGDRVELIPEHPGNNDLFTYPGTVLTMNAAGTHGNVQWDERHMSSMIDFVRLRRTSRPVPVAPPTPRPLESQPRIGTRVQRASAGGTWHQGRVTETCGSLAVHVAWDGGRLVGFGECNDWNNLYAVGPRERRPQVRREGPRPPKVKKPCTHGTGVLTTASGKIKCGSCGVDVSPSVNVAAR